MCGIIGYVGNDNNCSKILISGLRSLEYRGYDSAGIVIVPEGKQGLLARKVVGRVQRLDDQIDHSTFLGKSGIAHTRWATHGKPSVPNSHPHFDETGRIAVVHNGIIENFSELKQGLLSRGHVFSSETDTEVIAHLIEENYLKAKEKDSDNSKIQQSRTSLRSASGSQTSDTLEEAVGKVLPLLKGSYAIGVISSLEPGKIVGARKESPLVIGLGKGENFLASDVPAFLSRTNKALLLNDGEMAVITKEGVRILSGKRKVSRKPFTVKWSREEAELSGYPHFMLKEIEEQPRSLLKLASPNEAAISALAKEVKNAKRVLMVACGTSRYACLIGRYAIMKNTGIYCDVLLASEAEHFLESIDKRTLVIAVSQSGETADVMEAVRKAKGKGARIHSIVNVVGSSLTRESDGVIYMHAGPEVGVAATKTFSAEVLAFFLLVKALKGENAGYARVAKELSSLIGKTIEENRAGVKALSEELKGLPAVYFIGRGINFAAALEGALKFKEISYIHAEGMPAGELKHGTISLIEKGVPVVSINPSDDTYEETISNTMEVKAREAFVIGVSDRENPIYDRALKIPAGADPLFFPLLSVIPLQMLSYYVGVAKGNDVDKPRNLAKSVTVK